MDAVVYRSTDSACATCGNTIPPGVPVKPLGENQPAGTCLDCAGLGDLVFLASGDPALTRRAAKLSRNPHQVLDWSRRRKRWERRGTLVEPEALAEAEVQCMLDADKRAAARMKARSREAAHDREYVAQFAGSVRRQYPGMPAETAGMIALHACEKHSGRVGRSAAAKELDPEMITLAVIAHVRHLHTDYDELLAIGVHRRDCRAAVRSSIDRVLDLWSKPK